MGWRVAVHSPRCCHCLLSAARLPHAQLPVLPLQRVPLALGPRCSAAQPASVPEGMQAAGGTTAPAHALAGREGCGRAACAQGPLVEQQLQQPLPLDAAARLAPSRKHQAAPQALLEAAALLLRVLLGALGREETRHLLLA